MKTGRPTVPPDYVSEKILKKKSRKKKYLFFDFMSISNIELKMPKIISAFFFRFYLDFTNR
jgi:hypothetical protein